MFPTHEGEVAPAGLWTEPADPTVRSTFAILVARMALLSAAISPLRLGSICLRVNLGPQDPLESIGWLRPKVCNRKVLG